MVPRFALSGVGPSSNVILEAPRRRHRLGTWASDIAGVMDAGTIADFNQSISDSLTLVANAYDQLNQCVQDMQTLSQMQSSLQSQVGAPNTSDPTNPATIANEPLLLAQANINIEGNRLAGLDLLFTELSSVFTDVSNNFTQANLSQEANSARIVAGNMQNFMQAVQSQIYSALPSASQESQTLQGQFTQALSQAGLQQGTNNDEPAYWDALNSVLSQLSDSPDSVDSASVLPGGTLQGERLGADPVTIAALVAGVIKVVAIGATIVAALVLINQALQTVFGAGNSAMQAAASLQQARTARAQAVAAGTMTQAEADAANQSDSQSFQSSVAQAMAAATTGAGALTAVLTYAGIGVVGLIVLHLLGII